MRYIFLILILIAGAPVFSGAFARNKVTKKVAKSRGSSAASDSADKTGSILDLIINTQFTFDAPTAAPTPAKGSPKREVTSSGVLEFMKKAYADHGFYQSGHWDDAEDWSAITRSVTLPPYNPADFIRPVRGIVTSGYGFRPKFGRMHKGIDLALNIGDTVKAALPGVVAKVAYDAGGYGHYVVLVHNNGMETRYAHLQAPVATLGETLKAGEPLGLGGNSGNSTGPHLHFEVRYRGTALDPASLFNFQNFIPQSNRKDEK